MNPGTSSKLGTASQITIGTGDLQLSADFYTRLGFKVIAEGESPRQWASLTDGALMLLLNQESNHYIGLTYFSRDMDRTATLLQNAGYEFVHRNDKDGKFFEGIILTPDGFGISLVNIDPEGSYQPRPVNLLNFPKDKYDDIENYPNKACGILGEFTLPVNDLNRSLEYWLGLGFTEVSINENPYPWAIITDQVNVIGLHQTKDFSSPGISFFARDMTTRIKHLQQNGLASYFHEMTGQAPIADNGVLTSPDFLKVFLFKL